MRRTLILVLIPLTLAACASTGLRDLRTNSSGPDEFRVAPVKALEAPNSYASLPPPTPGQANLTDRSALNEGIAAFGGRPEAAGGGIPASDGALVQHASRLGVTPGVRQQLAETDADFRRRKARLTQYRIFPTDNYAKVYRRQTLNAEVEAARWRRAGARTPSSPPAIR
ncbi:DUF3035 domain-containing protein [Sulfitobacter sp. SK011]|uniref:DUF3035 domain-containing protein n=1 Tax=Sulfitobacter sp. SK011 TaxID=1389004 RepID=UPI000E0A1E87|nr:DUF3035 domain-containing protein [Sulfitobacter sp. SK011]AXI40988.1 DUF3035 domain-containing protein [Sulfitobacter sp. SK011]